MTMNAQTIRSMRNDGKMVQVRNGYVFAWEGGPYIEVYGMDQETPFEVINTTDRNGAPATFHQLQFLGAIDDFLDTISGRDMKATPGFRTRGTSRWKVLRALADDVYGPNWKE